MARARSEGRHANVRGDVGGIVQERGLVLDDPHRQAKPLVERSHPLGIALGQVVVHGDDVHAAPGERVQVRGQRRHQGLAFAGGHLGDGPAMEHHPPDELHVEVPHPQHPASRLPAHREDLGEQVIEGLGRRPVGAETRRSWRVELGIGEPLQASPRTR